MSRDLRGSFWPGKAIARRRRGRPHNSQHKRALDGDRGLNTGGMGTYSPTPFLSEAELAAVGESILSRGCADAPPRELISTASFIRA